MISREGAGEPTIGRMSVVFPSAVAGADEGKGYLERSIPHLQGPREGRLQDLARDSVEVERHPIAQTGEYSVTRTEGMRHVNFMMIEASGIDA